MIRAIKTTTTYRSSPHRLNPKHLEVLEQWPDDFIKAGLAVDVTHEPTPVIARALVVPKTNEMGEVTGWRVVGDFRETNKHLLLEQGELPLIADLLTMAAEGDVISKFDAKDFYLQIPIADDSQWLAVIQAGHRKIKFRGTLPGIASAATVAQRLSDKAFHIPGVRRGYVDDLIAPVRREPGDTKADFEKRMLASLSDVVDRCIKFHICRNAAKTELFAKKINVLGHTVSRDH